jgi:RNA polymerase sigma-32 factor
MSNVATAPIDFNQNRVLILDYLEGNESALDTLVHANKGLVTTVAQKYIRYGIPMEDLIQQGFIGLIKAAQKYRPDRDVKNHLINWIRQSIQRYCEEQAGFIRVTKNRAERKLFYRRALITQFNESTDGAEREEILDRLQSETGLSEEEIETASYNVSLHTVSLDREIDGNGSSGSLYDVIDIEDQETLEDQYVREDANEKVRQIIAELAPKLNERELFILHERYLNDDPLTLEEIGTKFDLTRERVRQIEASLLGKLRKRLMRAAKDFLPDLGVFMARLS